MRLILKILAAPLVVALTLFVWICTILLYCTGMVLGLAALVVALLGMAVLVTYSLQNGIILLVIAFLMLNFAAALGGSRREARIANAQWNYVGKAILTSNPCGFVSEKCIFP